MKQRRIVSLDIIRGLAIYLIVFMNSLEVIPRVAGENIIETHTDAIIYNLEEIFIENKFIGLFSLLFGISMGIFMDNARRKNLSPLKLMFRRLLFLLIVGIMTFMFLTPFLPYAIIGLIIMFVENLKKPKLTLIFLIVVILSFIAISIYQNNFFHLNIAITLDMLLGLFLWQSGTISNFKEYKRQYLVSLIIGLIIITLVDLNWMYFDFDKNLIKQDVQGSIAHATMLAKQHIITDDEAQSIINELKNIQSDFEEGKLKFKASLEDIHLNIEHKLIQRIG